ncbi:MAG: hypothetical protein AB7O38_14010 [Pirellulaceae bacterium]
MRTAMFVFLAVAACAMVGCQHNTCRTGCGCSSVSSRGLLANHRGLQGGCSSCGQGGWGIASRGGCSSCQSGGSCQSGNCGTALGGCNTCGNSTGRGLLQAHHDRKPDHIPHLPHGYAKAQMNGAGAPPSAAFAYPYYTTRAPRDFLLNNPPSIGP